MSGTAGLALAMASFVATHLLLSHPLRAPLAGVLGERGFLGLYSLVAAVMLGWTVHAAGQAPALPPLWIAPTGAWHVASLVMLLAAILLVGSLAGNPAMVEPSGSPRFPDRARGVFAITRHPMMWAFMLWALVHAALMPTPANLIVTGGIGLLALIGALGQDARKARTIGAPWRAWQMQTSFVPFAALMSGQVPWRAAMLAPVPLFGGLALWLVATWVHPTLGGPAVGPWMWIG